MSKSRARLKPIDASEKDNQKANGGITPYHKLTESEKAALTQHVIVTPTEIADRYTFLNKIGSGTQGNVFRATRISDGKVVAVKKVRIDSVNTWKEYDLFHREADVLASLNERGVAEFYEAIECLSSDPPAAYIVQELIEGRSLQLMLKTGFRFTLSRVFKMAYDMVVLLERLHTHNPPIIHRDIKPNNIIMKPMMGKDDFMPYLIDFGAVANPTVQKGGSTTAGTHGYMPPEQLLGRPCPASDIYALGATIVYMLCGVEPASIRVADNRLVFDTYLENVPRPVVTVLHKLLDPRVETRLCDYRRLKDIFGRFARDNYYIEDDDSLALDPVVINNKLSGVNAFNQAGNLDLWMQLPERTPRQVPESFSEAIISYNDFTQISQLKETRLKKFMRTLIVGLLFMLAILIFLATDANDISFVGAYSVLLVLLGGAFILMLIDIISTLDSIVSIKSHSESIHKLYRKSRSAAAVELACGYDRRDDVPMLTMLKFGRKAIATIIDFEDIPVDERLRECHGMDISAPTRVPFRLRYRFNPPDDASASDLVHEVIIYNHQTEGLESGTPIPILYYINPKDNSDVLSMPYPFPFKEMLNTQLSVFNKNNLYGHTKGIH